MAITYLPSIACITAVKSNPTLPRFAGLLIVLPSSLHYNLKTDLAQTRVKDGLRSGPTANCLNLDLISPEQPLVPAAHFWQETCENEIGVKNERETLGCLSCVNHRVGK